MDIDMTGIGASGAGGSSSSSSSASKAGGAAAMEVDGEFALLQDELDDEAAKGLVVEYYMHTHEFGSRLAH